MVSGAVHKKRDVALTTLILRRTELGKRFQGEVLVCPTLLSSNILLQLEQSVCHNTGGTGILRCLYATRVVHIPQWYEVVAGLAQTLEVYVGNLLRKV